MKKQRLKLPGRIEPWWKGQTAVILASGPSMSPAVVEVVRSSTFRVIAVNTTFRLAPWADMVYAADSRWWTAYKEEVSKLPTLKVAAEPTEVDDVIVLRVTGKQGYDPDPEAVRTGGNSGYQAIHVAVTCGCNRILLCGMDMHGDHWHGRHPSPLRDHGEDIYRRWLPNFETLVQPLQERGVEVVNCTPGSALRCFPTGHLEDFCNARSVSAA